MVLWGYLQGSQPQIICETQECSSRVEEIAGYLQGKSQRRSCCFCLAAGGWNRGSPATHSHEICIQINQNSCWWQSVIIFLSQCQYDLWFSMQIHWRSSTTVAGIFPSCFELPRYLLISITKHLVLSLTRTFSQMSHPSLKLSLPWRNWKMTILLALIVFPQSYWNVLLAQWAMLSTHCSSRSREPVVYYLNFLKVWIHY